MGGTRVNHGQCPRANDVIHRQGSGFLQEDLSPHGPVTGSCLLVEDLSATKINAALSVLRLDFSAFARMGVRALGNMMGVKGHSPPVF